MVSTKTLLLKHYYRRQGAFTKSTGGEAGALGQEPGENRGGEFF